MSTEEPSIKDFPQGEEKKLTRQRRDVSLESVEQDFDLLLKDILQEIETSKNIIKNVVSPKKTQLMSPVLSVKEIQDNKIKALEKKGKLLLKFLRAVGRRVKMLKSDSIRTIKQKRKTNRSTNSNYGFLKPVKLSAQLAEFTGWDENVPRSRRDVTKFLCEYISVNGLQNPEDRRQIILDGKMSKLLEYDEKKDGGPLTYYRLQQKLKPHYIKDDE